MKFGPSFPEGRFLPDRRERMPGLPKVPSAEKIDLTDDGKVVGLF
ncbi:MAG: hypothetical protein ACREI9_14260 [Nitrospiraceae bacterium]